MNWRQLYQQYYQGTIDPNLRKQLEAIRDKFYSYRGALDEISRRSVSEKWVLGRKEREQGDLYASIFEKHFPELERLVGSDTALLFAHQWLRDIGMSSEHRSHSLRLDRKFDEGLKRGSTIFFSIKNSGIDETNLLNFLRLTGTGVNQNLPNLQNPTISGWQLPEEGLLQTGEFATQLAKQRQQQDANLLASGLTRQQILQQRGSENIVRELGLSKMVAEQRRRAIQDWLQTVSGLQQQVRPPDFTGLKEMAMAYQQGTNAQQQMLVKFFENLMRQGG